MMSKQTRRSGVWAVALTLMGLLAAGESWAQQRTTTGTRGVGTAGARATTGTAARGTQGTPMLGEAMVSSDSQTRRLIVVTDDETAEHISKVIENLDRPKPQVLIKVVFVEATYRKGLDIGVEGQYRKDGSSTTGVVNQIFGLASQGANPTPPAINNAGAGIYQILGQDYQVTLRAIAEAGSAEVLSRPSILARNNQQATITVGQQVPLVTNTRFDTLGNQINTVSYQDVGIILRVTPFISPDGLVEMIVSPETSELAERSQWVPIADGALAPTINTRSADTVVVTPDGQTVVIGGLMQKSKAKSESKIPILGDIPLLGMAFKRTVRSDSKSELLIFLTPYIVREPSDLASLTETERNKSQVPGVSASEEELNRLLDGLPRKAPDSERQRNR